VSSANATVTTWLKAINAALGAWQIGVVSNLGVGAQELVTNARFGRVLDTIRSRRDKFTEDYALGPAIIGSNDPDAFTTRSH
jgi:hypothetical protein